MEYICEHFGLAASDPEKLRDWYVNTLGARALMQLAAQPPAYLIELAGGFRIEIYQAGFAMRLTCDNKLRGWRHLALRVANLEVARNELAAHGVRLLDPVKPAGGGGRVLFFADPEGNLLHLVERPDGFQLP